MNGMIQRNQILPSSRLRPFALSGRSFGLLALLAMLVCLPLAAQELPWQQKGKKVEGQPGNLTPRAMLALLGVDDSHWDNLVDGVPLESNESETLTRLLFRMPRFDPPQWDRWCEKEADLAALAKMPKEFRASPFIVSGRAKQVEAIDLLPELVPLYEFRRYYRVTIASPGSPNPVVVLLRSVPALWKDTKTLDEPVSVQAIFMKAGETVDEKTPLYFVAPRLRWFPEQVNEALGVNEDLVWLGKRGMDVALWDEVRKNNGAAISADEGECFYRLLALLKKEKAADLKELEAKPFDLTAMLQRPDELLGQAFTVSGTARRIQKVSVPEQFRERLGLEHYYEVLLFLPLENQAIRLSSKPNDKDAPTFTDGFPVTVNVARLPPELEPGRDVYHHVRVKGVFFKLWAYQSEFIKAHDKNQRQPSPLLMATDIAVLPNAVASGWSAWTPTLLMFAVILGVMIVWFFAWRSLRGDKKFERKVLRKYTHGAAKMPSTLDSPPLQDKQP